MRINKFLTSTVIVVLVACNKQYQDNSQYMHLTVITDPTDEHMIQCDPTEVLRLYNLQEHKNEAVAFRYTEIGDFMLTPTIDIRLENIQASKKKNKNNEALFREREIIRFHDSVKQVVGHANQKNDSTSRKNNSEVFRKICSELAFLQSNNSMYKGLLIFSNLAENSSIVSVYNEKISRLLHETPQNIERVFEETKLLPDRLDSITVVFCYMPLDREDDKRFNALSKIYINMLSKRGVNVIIHANNTFYGLWPGTE